MQTSLTPAILAKLRKQRPYPAVTLAMPTHRRRPENAQDPVRLGNLVSEAERRLDADPLVTKELREDVVGQLKSAVREIDLAHAKDGLVVFAAPGEHETWFVDRAVPERVVVADTYLTRNLVAADAAGRPFRVLSVAADRIALWDGRGDRVTEVTGHGFPLTRSLEDPDAEREERIGDLPSTFRDEQTRQFFRDADRALAGAPASGAHPLYVTGDPAALSLLADVGTAAYGAVQVPFGGLAQAAPDAVAKAVAPARADEAQRTVAEALADLDRARGNNTYAAGVDEVWQKASDGRIHRLVVEENYRVTVRAGEGHLMPAEDDDADAVHDIVDEIVESALETGAGVAFVPDGTLADAGHVAAVLRF
ncbi:chemotaxis protein [Streptomyces sp. VRA16 Mangrove soil]|uniref:baeRF3 domain-containing protein n=1 Tax=Streptomyces sp. VRA16 Mangrove soil TaxID=2817434 RepID=UPI001A9DD531|nr:chemotaxis protein [Streptomyces sp. VRA16 Mangrove soil]MBO1330690.1 chemotaxis protein [Streptomyces sp. VRA16 Mangrove soil]